MQRAPPSELCSFHTASGEYSTASHQAHPRPVTSALQTEAGVRPWSASCCGFSWRACSLMAACTSILPLATSFHTVPGENVSAGHQAQSRPITSALQTELPPQPCHNRMFQLATGTKHKCNGRSTLDGAPLAMMQLTGMKLTAIESAAVERLLGCVAARL